MLKSISIWGLVLVMTMGRVYSTDLLFSDSVTEDAFSSGKWVKSAESRYADQPVEIRAPKNAATGFEQDLAFVLSEPHKHYGIATKFPSPISAAGGIVVQYELKLEDSLQCGGAYIKLLRADTVEGLTNDTPYAIMFGPDRCGATNKVHFIVQYQNPISSVWEEKHYNETLPMKVDKKTHLYTLQIDSDDTFTIYVDKKDVKKGSLLTHMRPAINPPKMIDDPSDSKPEDWVEEETIIDTTAVKSDDWDEDAPKMIVDPKATKPEGWLDDAPEKVPDPESKKPDDWDDNEDGIWDAPLVPNPDCKVGCGVWKAPMIKNPNYKGKWTAPKIPNPAYKGKWLPRQIDNPNYFVDENPISKLASLTGLAIEIWTINGGITFDNFVVARNVNAAFEYAKTSTDLKIEAEKEADKKLKKDSKKKELDNKKAEAAAKSDVKEKYLAYLETYADEFFDIAKENPYAILGCILSVILALVLLMPSKKKGKSRQEDSAAAPTPSPAADETSVYGEKDIIPTQENPMKASNKDSEEAKKE